MTAKEGSVNGTLRDRQPGARSAFKAVVAVASEPAVAGV